MGFEYYKDEVENLKGQLKATQVCVNPFLFELLKMSSYLKWISLMGRSVSIICQNIYRKDGKYRKLILNIKDALISSVSSWKKYVFFNMYKIATKYLIL